MGCFCQQSVTELQRKLQRMQQTAPDSATQDGATQTPRETQQTEAVASSAAWLSARGLPAPPWRPDPQWLAAKLPTPQLPPEAVATLTQLATLRQQMQSALGIDPLQTEQAKQLTRIVATQNRRLTDLARTPPPDAGPWQSLAAQSEAADAVQEAAKSGLLDPSPEQVEAYSQPAGRPMQQWLALLRQVRALAPLVAAANQLGLPLDQPEELAQRLADAVRKLRNVVLPPPAEPLEAARLMSLLSASDRLKQTLGVDPTEAGYQEVQRAVAKKTAGRRRAAATDAARTTATARQPALLPDAAGLARGHQGRHLGGRTRTGGDQLEGAAGEQSAGIAERVAGQHARQADGGGAGQQPGPADALRPELRRRQGHARAGVIGGTAATTRARYFPAGLVGISDSGPTLTMLPGEPSFFCGR